MNKQPLVTVRMPAYNHEKYVEKAVMSVVNQTYRNIQFIVVDDGSTDSTPEIIQSLADKYAFTFIRQENQGISATYNIIHSLTIGEYVIGCASDDYLAEDAIENLVAIALNTNVGIVSGRVKIVTNSNEIISELNYKINSNCKKSDLLRKKIICPPQGFMYSYTVLDSIMPIPKDVKLEDAYAMMKIKNNTTIGSLNKTVKYYRSHENNVSKKTLEMYHNKKNLLEKYADSETDELYIQSTKFGWFTSLALKHPTVSLKYLPAATLFMLDCGVPYLLVKPYIGGLLKYFKISRDKYSQ